MITISTNGQGKLNGKTFDVKIIHIDNILDIDDSLARTLAGIADEFADSVTENGMFTFDILDAVLGACVDEDDLGYDENRLPVKFFEFDMDGKKLDEQYNAIAEDDENTQRLIEIDKHITRIRDWGTCVVVDDAAIANRLFERAIHDELILHGKSHIEADEMCEHGIFEQFATFVCNLEYAYDGGSIFDVNAYYMLIRKAFRLLIG